ncbi:DUF1853 family protein [Pseudomonas sp. HK3]
MPIKYNSPSVRHLAWCLFSEQMAITNTPILTIEPSQELLNWLSILDENPQPLEEYLANHNRVLLGSYFECLWQFFFQHSPHWQLLDHHIQIIDAKQTIGELDILARDNQHNCDYHVELAVKFYLKQPHSSGEALQDWLGPQSHDRLDLKLNKLTNKQIPFLHHSATQAELLKRGLPLEPLQALIMKGYLFEPWPTSNVRYHTDINPNIEHAYWLHYQHIQTLFKQTDDITHWVILPKSHWLGHYQHNESNDIALLSNDNAKHIIDQHFAGSAYPFALMLAGMQGDADNLAESKRFMLVHNNWPTQISARKD